MDFDQNNRTVRTFPLDQMATGNASQSVPPVVTSVATMAGSGVATSQSIPSVAQQPGPSTSIPLGAMAQHPLYTQTTSTPFSYGMPPVTIGSTCNFFANNMVPSMPMSSRKPSNNFRPFQFGNADIPLSNPTLGGAFA